MRTQTLFSTVGFSIALLSAVALFGVPEDGVAQAAGVKAASSAGKAKGKAHLSGATKTSAFGVVVPPRVDDIEQMCGMLLGCKNLPLERPTSDFGLCVRHYMNRLASPHALTASLTIRECGLNSMTCRQFAHCAMRGAEPTACAGRGLNTHGATVGRCDLGGRALRCLDGKVVGVRDCPRGGELCAIRHGKAACVSGKCKKDSPAVCSKDGYRIVSCQDERRVSVNCRAFGLVCDAGKAGKPRCVPAKAKTCDQKTKPRCKGSDAVHCVSGREVTVKCGTSQMVCGVNVKDDLQIGACALSPYDGKDNECDPAKFRTRCTGKGKDVTYCIGGRKRAYHCRSYTGLRKCVGRPGQAHCE